jgi:hypothetical protein
VRQGTARKKRRGEKREAKGWRKDGGREGRKEAK